MRWLLTLTEAERRIERAHPVLFGVAVGVTLIVGFAALIVWSAILEVWL